jgi:hypothetical protein
MLYDFMSNGPNYAKVNIDNLYSYVTYKNNPARKLRDDNDYISQTLKNYVWYAPGNYQNVGEKIKDTNIIENDFEVFPRNIYKGDLLPEPNYISQYRDKNSIEVDEPLPATYSSIFNRTSPGCMFGYCNGSTSGRNYRDPLHNGFVYIREL